MSSTRSSDRAAPSTASAVKRVRHRLEPSWLIYQPPDQHNDVDRSTRPRIPPPPPSCRSGRRRESTLLRLFSLLVSSVVAPPTPVNKRSPALTAAPHTPLISPPSLPTSRCGPCRSAVVAFRACGAFAEEAHGGQFRTCDDEPKRCDAPPRHKPGRRKRTNTTAPSAAVALSRHEMPVPLVPPDDRPHNAGKIRTKTIAVVVGRVCLKKHKRF